MLDIYDKRDLIVSYEQMFANIIAAEVIEKPKLSIWMILIPVIFVHFFYRLNKVVDGRKEFAKNFMISRHRALEEACRIAESGHGPDINKMCKMSTVPEKIYPEYGEWLKLLVEHYVDLLRSPGNSYEDLIRSTYTNRTNYQLFLNRLNTVEQRFNAALKPHLYETTPNVNGIVKIMEAGCTRARKSHTDYVFPTS